MARSVTIAIIAALFSEAAARVVPSSHVRHESRSEHLNGHWIRENRIEESVIVPVRVGLTQNNLDMGEALLMNISHPNSEQYGKHLSASEVDEMFAPSKDSIDAVTAWLKSALSDREITLSQSQQWLELNATVAELQDLLHTDYHQYKSKMSWRAALGCEEYHVPMQIRDHIDFITPGITMLKFKKRADAMNNSGPLLPTRTRKPMPDLLPEYSNSLSNCSMMVTPECVRAMYNVADKPEGHPDNSIGIYSSQGEQYSPDSLNTFFKYFAPEIPQGTQPEFVGVDGAPSPSPLPYDAAYEADLDFQASFPLAYPNKVVKYLVDDFYYEGGGGGGGVSGLFNTFLDALDKSYCTYSGFGETGDLKGVDPTYPDTSEGGYDQPEQCGAYTPNNVISISYAEDGQSLPMNYQRRQCHEWMKLGLRGVTVIFASGDSGVGWFGICNDNTFGTVTPADCPFVTAVGATNLTSSSINNGQVKFIEHAARLSGGGFSNIFGTPSYQADAVNSYFKNHPPPYDFYNITLNATHTKGLYNRGGRGYPDLSAIGLNFVTWVENGTLLADGTSVATPVVAGLITRINSFRMNAGKKPVGFINPILYQHPEAFNDITVGNNPGCNTKGFSAVKGWDPVTGLGTPNYSKLKEVFLSLP
ncbi:peptidase S8/S53 domain-containing protein [Trichoderma chlorosporum]